MKVAVVYTMKGCPFCVQMKEELKENNLIFVERDIDEFEEEYEEFSKITENEYVPAIMLLTLNDEEEAENVTLLAPERDFNNIHEGVEMTKKYLSE